MYRCASWMHTIKAICTDKLIFGFTFVQVKYLYSYSPSVLQPAGCREELQVVVTWITEVVDICVWHVCARLVHFRYFNTNHIKHLECIHSHLCIYVSQVLEKKCWKIISMGDRPQLLEYEIIGATFPWLLSNTKLSQVIYCNLFKKK